MAQVRAKTLCFIDNGLRNEGDIFEYNGGTELLYDGFGSIIMI